MCCRDDTPLTEKHFIHFQFADVYGHDMGAQTEIITNFLVWVGF